MKKKFEIIEEGRLGKLEMQTLVGGTCTNPEATYYGSCPGGANNYTVGTCIGGTNYSTCRTTNPEKYISCDTSSLYSCNDYAGPQGPNGNTIVLPSIPSIVNPGSIIAGPSGFSGATLGSVKP